MIDSLQCACAWTKSRNSWQKNFSLTHSIYRLKNRDMTWTKKIIPGDIARTSHTLLRHAVIISSLPYGGWSLPYAELADMYKRDKHWQIQIKILVRQSTLLKGILMNWFQNWDLVWEELIWNKLASLNGRRTWGWCKEKFNGGQFQSAWTGFFFFWNGTCFSWHIWEGIV